MDTRKAFGIALRHRRLHQRLTQEDFSELSSRTYLSSLERGIKCPTLDKVVELASVLGIHPLTLIAETFLTSEPDQTVDTLLKRVHAEISEGS
ncbi:transcriptional regulator [Pseudomonas sp. Bc-h]|jgi:transcriptional regulator with XRE-family HTH domain|uniref:helix-turn-helix domain-containing protein n=1 Tax=Pseudomonas sp. Bc-h TaxID=1943632 RepID=UPI0009DB1EED|nr:helix-turn-helix transcriptional regulator [Pseudomonas sp. Bc-h]OQR36618.1 transcriptional regulator [Pseudomonas sp. Bc-h]